MGIEYEVRDGALTWIRNPITGVISYVVDLGAKNFSFTLGARASGESPPHSRALSSDEIAIATAACPFCPGNEHRAPPELLRVGPEELLSSNDPQSPWLIRGFNNLFPRIPPELTGGRNESYILVEDPRHYLEKARSHSDLMYSGALNEEHFIRLLLCSAELTRRALSNPSVTSVVVRKNQGRESGASQPHVHQQLIGSPVALPVLAAELQAQQAYPALWQELLALVGDLGLLIEQSDGVVSYVSPIGAFPRSYDVMMPEFRGLICELNDDRIAHFGRALHRILRVLGPLPLDYEIHQCEGLPLHAHVNGRLFPYSNVAGTLNLPKSLLHSAAAVRHAMQRPAEVSQG